jgi:2-polyprenyl-6-methoxyphenol hydroxylase-like FAD-dependent oxidoreductase
VRRIVVVGSGQAGLLLALGLRQHEYEVTVVTDRTAEDLRTGRVISNQCLFEPALKHERSLGLNLWDDRVPPVAGVGFAAAGPPGTTEPAMGWTAELDHQAESVDQRLKMSDWLVEFERRGGEIRYGRAGPAELEDLAREFDLVLVAAGRGPQFDGLFPRDAARSRFDAPQRAISLTYGKPTGDALTCFPGVTFGLAQAGEVFALPVLTTTGPVCGICFFAVPGGPLDRFDGVTDPDEHFELTTLLLREQFPWLEPVTDDLTPRGPLDVLSGRITPIVRDAVGTLPSGAKILAMGDSAVTNDPIAGQGANMATRCAAVYQDAILAHGDRPFDEAFMRASFETYWGFAQHATRFSNDLLEPPLPHVLATLAAAQELPEVAHRFAHLFDDPADYTAWLADADVSSRYLAEARSRAA